MSVSARPSMLRFVKLLAVVCVLVCAWGCGQAGAVTLVRPDGSVAQPEQRWADAAKVPTPPGTITIHDGSCPYYGEGWSCAYPTEIWLAPGASRFVFLHELGHSFDWQQPPLQPIRARLRALLDATTGDWFDASLPHGERAGERFANAYSMCATGIPGWLRGGVRWPLEGWLPTVRRLRAICAAIRTEGGWYMRPNP